MIGHSIDPIRALIMKLEAEKFFLGEIWLDVLAILKSQGRVAAYADAERRMQTARSNQIVPVFGRNE